MKGGADLSSEDAYGARVNLGDQILESLGRVKIVVLVPAAVPVGAGECPVARLGVIAELGKRAAGPLGVLAGRKEAGHVGRAAFVDRGAVATEHNLEQDFLTNGLGHPPITERLERSLGLGAHFLEEWQADHLSGAFGGMFGVSFVQM